MTDYTTEDARRDAEVLRNLETKKPTIADLEAVLDGRSRKIRIKPDGSITVDNDYNAAISKLVLWLAERELKRIEDKELSK